WRCRRCVDRAGRRIEVLAGVCLEPALAARAAEQEFAPVMLGAVGRVGLHDHPADGIARFVRAGFPPVVMRCVMGEIGHVGRSCGCNGYTVWWYINQVPIGGIMLDAASTDKTLKALNRVAGQVRGITRMVEEDRYCIDIVTQVEAARAALARIESDLLRQHLG